MGIDAKIALEPFTPGCTGKLPYPSAKAARIAISKHSATRRRKLLPTPYLCRHCAGWHITSHSYGEKP